MVTCGKQLLPVNTPDRAEYPPYKKQSPRCEDCFGYARCINYSASDPVSKDSPLWMTFSLR